MVSGIRVAGDSKVIVKGGKIMNCDKAIEVIDGNIEVDGTVLSNNITGIDAKNSRIKLDAVRFDMNQIDLLLENTDVKMIDTIVSVIASKVNVVMETSSPKVKGLLKHVKEQCKTVEDTTPLQRKKNEYGKLLKRIFAYGSGAAATVTTMNELRPIIEELWKAIIDNLTK